jgi:hypothetical protein
MISYPFYLICFSYLSDVCVSTQLRHVSETELYISEYEFTSFKTQLDFITVTTMKGILCYKNPKIVPWTALDYLTIYEKAQVHITPVSDLPNKTMRKDAQYTV